MFRALGWAVNVLLVALWFANGQEFGLAIDGDEFCARLGESAGRLNPDTV